MEIRSLIYGLYPRSEKVRKSLSRWERNMISEGEVAELMYEESQLYYKMCKVNGIELCSDPLFNWYDILRPLSLSIEGITLGSLTRYKETNTFYRMPIINDIISLGEINVFRSLKDNPPLPLYHPNDSDYLYFLPGIESFIKMSRVRGEGKQREDEMANIYNDIIKKYSIKSLVIYEPMNVSNFSIYDKISPSVEILLVTSGKVDQNMFSSLSRKFYSILSDNPYVVSKYCKIPGIKIVDAFNTHLERDALEKMKKYKDDFDEIIVTSNEYLDFLPRIIADRKIEMMGSWGR